MRTARRCCRLTRSAKRSRAASRSPARTRALTLAASSESLDVGCGWTRAVVFGAVDGTDRGSSPGLATRRGGVLIGIRQPATAVYARRRLTFSLTTLYLGTTGFLVPRFRVPSSKVNLRTPAEPRKVEPRTRNQEPGTCEVELTDPERTSTIGVFVAIAAREIAMAINERWCR